MPDTVVGRFEMIILHAVLVFRKLRSLAGGEELAEQLFEVITADLDRSLREMGQGDMGVGKRVKQMASAFYGRAHAYNSALDGNENLDDALRRNVFGTVDPCPESLATMACYVRETMVLLDPVTVEELRQAAVSFPLLVSQPHH